MKNILNKILEETGKSRTQFAKDIDISKSYVLNVLNGKNKCTQRMFNNILNLEYIPVFLKEDFENAYFRESFGAEDFDQVKFFLDELGNYDNNFSKNVSVGCRNDFWTRIFSGEPTTQRTNGSNEIFEVITFFTEKAIKKEVSYFYTNYSVNQNKLDDILFTLFRDRDYSKKLDYARLICMPTNFSKYIIKAQFQANKWARILCNTFCINGCPEQSASNLLPYYIITDECLIRFNEDFSAGYVSTEPNLLECEASEFIRIKEKVFPLANIVFDESVCLGQTDVFGNDSIVSYCLAGIPCVGPYLTYDMLNEIAKDVPGREMLIQLFISHYSKGRATEYISESAYWDFVNNGDTIVVTDKYLNKCSFLHRANLLEILSEKKDKSNTPLIKLVKSSSISIPNYYSLDVFNTHAVVMSYFKNEPCATAIKPYAVVMDIDFNRSFDSKRFFENLFKYISQRNFAMSPENQSVIFNRMIVQCKALADESQNS